MLRISTTIGFMLILFGWWGLETPTGRHWFDEMAGIIPFLSGVTGAIIVLVTLAQRIWRRPPHG